MESVEGVGAVTVDTLQLLSHDVLGEFCPGRFYQVRFEDVSRDLPLMEVRNLNLTGDQIQLSAREVYMYVCAYVCMYVCMFVCRLLSVCLCLSVVCLSVCRLSAVCLPSVRRLSVCLYFCLYFCLYLLNSFG